MPGVKAPYDIMEKLIIQLKDAINQPNIDAEQLVHHFYTNNPYWVQPGEPMDLQNFTRTDAINILKAELSIGYSVIGDIITVGNPNQYLNSIMHHLQAVATSCLTHPYPLGWWKEEVCGYGDILISYGYDLMTLNEFMLYAITKKNEGITTFYIGSIFEYQ